MDIGDVGTVGEFGSNIDHWVNEVFTSLCRQWCPKPHNPHQTTCRVLQNITKSCIKRSNILQLVTFHNKD